MSKLGRQLRDYRLTTAEILYRLPDHPALLQSYIWQDYDLLPDYPVLHRFLDFWRRSLDGQLYAVSVGSVPIIAPPKTRVAGACLTLH
jgi:uncharacterized protein Usg